MMEIKNVRLDQSEQIVKLFVTEDDSLASKSKVKTLGGGHVNIVVAESHSRERLVAQGEFYEVKPIYDSYMRMFAQRTN